MKFFTPEWSLASQRTLLGFGLREDNRAGTFDESFYDEVYAEVYKTEYRRMKDVHEVSFADLMSRLHN